MSSAFFSAKSPGVSSYAGIGIGIGIGIGQGFGNVVNTTAVKSTVESSQTSFVNNIGGGPNAILCNVRVNGELQPDSTRDCRYLPDHFCEDIDPRLVKPNCQPGDCYSWALTSDAVTGFESCPVVPETISTTARQITTSGQTIPPEEITTPEVMTTSAPPPNFQPNATNSSTGLASTGAIEHHHELFRPAGGHHDASHHCGTAGGNPEYRHNSRYRPGGF